MAQLCRVGHRLFSLSVWLIVFLQQRENAHLEKLVGERTASLRASEASVQASYELLHSVIEGTTDAIFVKDLAGRYQRSTRRAQPS